MTLARLTWDFSGAYVSGGFKTTCNGGFRAAVQQVRELVRAAVAWLVSPLLLCCQTILSGRGVITGEQFPWHSPLFEWALVNINAGTQNVIDGLVLVDSPEFHVASFADRPTLRNGS